MRILRSLVAGALALPLACSSSSPSTGPAPADQVAPTVTAVLPAGDAVSSAARIEVRFSEPMRPDASGAALLPPHAMGAAVWSGGNTVLTYEPAEPLPYGTTFTLSVSGADATGNALAGVVEYPFTVRDVPAVVVSPADGDTGVGTGASVVFSFPEEMGAAEPTVEATDGSAAVALGTGVWSQGRTVLTFTPPARLAFARPYTVTIAGAVAAGGDAYPAAATSFTTSEEPRIIAGSPADGARDVPAGSGIVLTFNVPMDPVSTSSVLTIIGCPALLWNEQHTRLSCTPVPALLPSQHYRFTVSSSARSAAGDPLLAHTWSFDTAYVDTRAPRLLAVTPADGKTDAFPGGSLVFTFDERMDQASAQQALAVTVRPDGGNAAPRLGTFSAWDAAGTVMTWTPSPAFARGDAVTWNLHAATAEDAAGNLLAAQTGAFHVVKRRTQTLHVEAANSGTLTRTPVPVFSRVLGASTVGDAANNSALRAFWSFDLGALDPAPARVLVATLEWNVSALTGAPARLGTLQLAGVFYGAALDAGSADFDAPVDTVTGCLTTPCLPGTKKEAIWAMPLVPGAGSANVTAKVVERDLGNVARGGRSQFAVRFTTTTNADNRADEVSFVTSTASSPWMVVDYEHGW